MLHAGIQGITDAAENAAKAMDRTENAAEAMDGTEIGTVTAVMTTIMTVAEMIPVLNRDLTQDPSAAERPAAVKKRTTDISEIQTAGHVRAFPYMGCPDLLLDESKSQ